MGRRAEDPLLQRAHPKPAPRMVPPGPVPQSHQEEGTGPGYRTDAHTGGQLVQEPQATRQGCGRQKQVSHFFFALIIFIILYRIYIGIQQ